MKIAMLQGKETTDGIFAQKHLDAIGKMGELVMNPIAGRPSAEQIAELIDGAEVAITSWGCPALTPGILDRAPNLKVILHAAGTVKGIVTPEVGERGIRVSNASDALGQGVAETALGLTIVSLKNIWRLAQSMRKGEWSKAKVTELYDITVGVIGAGRAGGHYIRLLRQFDVRILVFDPAQSAERIKEMGAELVSLEQLLRESDVVSIHAPSIPETANMLNEKTLSWMKDDAILINTARGTIIDEAALTAELTKGRLWACLDVTYPEPAAADHPFRSLPNVILTPHLAGAVNNGKRRIAAYVIDELARFQKGLPMHGEVHLGNLHLMA
ncbi:MAG: hypothetical protein K0R28_3399 [Paenibacillus sp.]|nr:hypothetical protein [Paenibacillus sp.]